MSKDSRPPMERFKVEGNVLKLTPRFDPRYQSRAGIELMNIVSSLAQEPGNPELVLDITDTVALPSMMLGILSEARDLTGKAGKRLTIRLKKATFERLRDLGLDGVITAPNQKGDFEGLEVVADSDCE